MTYFAIYWFCAGLASFSIDRNKMTFVGNLISSMLLGGIFVPVRILTKLAA